MHRNPSHLAIGIGAGRAPYVYLVALIRQAASDQPGVITHATPLRRILANNVPEKFNSVPLGSAQEARGLDRISGQAFLGDGNRLGALIGRGDAA